MRSCAGIRPQGGGLVKQRYMLSGMRGRSTYKLSCEESVALCRLTLDQPPVNTRAPSDRIFAPAPKPLCVVLVDVRPRRVRTAHKYHEGDFKCVRLSLSE